MKNLQTKSFIKMAKSETEPYNPWAVCNKSTGGKKDAPEKFEKCIQHLKKKNRKDNSDTKSSKPGGVYGPEVEEGDDRSGYHVGRPEKLHRRPKFERSPVTWRDVERKMKEPVMADFKRKNYWL